MRAVINNDSRVFENTTRGLNSGASVKTSHYVAGTVAATGVAFLVGSLMTQLWAALALHLPF